MPRKQEPPRQTRKALGFMITAALTVAAVWIFSRGSDVVQRSDRTRSGFIPAHKEKQHVNPQMGYSLSNASWGEVDDDPFAREQTLDDTFRNPIPELEGMDIAFLKPGQ